MSEPLVKGGVYNLTCNGIPITKEIKTIRVTKEICVPTMFEVVVPAESSDDPWWGMRLDEFKPGDEIAIGLGVGMPKLLVTGRITKIWPDLHGQCDARSVVTIAGFDDMVRFRFGTHTRTFEQQTSHSIVTEIASEVGLAVELAVEAEGHEGSVYSFVMQNNESDYTFLRRLCAELDYEMLMSGPRLLFRPSAEGLGIVKTLVYYEDFEAASLELTVPERGSSVQAFGYDTEIGAAFEVTEDSGTPRQQMKGRETGYQMAGSSFPSSGVAFERPDLDNREAAQEFAKSQYSRGISSFIEGRLKLCSGDASLSAGMNIELKGLGGRFNGSYYIYKSEYGYSNGRFSTELMVRRSGI